MTPLDLVKLTALMERTSGLPEVIVGLIDGPVCLTGPDFTSRIRDVSGVGAATCKVADSPACMHGTLIAAIFVARRGSAAAAICPGCTLAVRPIFPETGDS